MKKQHDTIESLLHTGTQTGLSANEHEEMWQGLKAYAEFHPVKPAPSRVFLSISKWLAVTASALVIMVGTGAASTDSLPGEPLYAIKVSVVEPMVGLTKTSDTEQLTYQAQLLERRLEEMQALASAEQLTEQTVSELEVHVEEHGSEIQKLLTSDTDESIPAEAKLDVLSDAVTTLRTHEFLEDTKVSKQRHSKFEKTEDAITTLYASEADEFATEQPQDAAAYIEDALEEIDDLTTTTGSTSPAFEEVNDFLTDVGEALDKGDINKALQFAGEAQQSIELNRNIAELAEEDPEASSSEE